MYSPIKKLGQNFLTDPAVVHKMVDALNISGDNDTIIEIGPGHGALTYDLAGRVAGRSTQIYAIEIDPRFMAKLNQMFLSSPNIHIIENDILKWLPTFAPQTPYKLIGSLPYYITSPILHAVVEAKVLPEIAVMLIQKEVAEKIVAAKEPRGYLSVLISTFFDVDYLGEVAKKRFIPIPQVDGAVIRLKKKVQGVSMPFDKIAAYEGFLHKAFAHPKKMVNKVFSKEELAKFSIDPNLRPHQVPPEKWLACFKLL